MRVVLGGIKPNIFPSVCSACVGKCGKGGKSDQRARGRATDIAETPISLDAPLADDEQYHLADMLEDTRATAPADIVTHHALRDQITSALDALNQRERQVIELRYGLHDGHCHTLEELSACFKLTRERIRQIEVKALRTLRHPMKVNLLKDFA